MILNKKRLRVAFQVLVTLCVLIAFGVYLYNNIDKYINLIQISASGVVMLFVLALIFPVLNGMQNTYLYRELGLKKFTHLDGWMITAASSLANQLPLPGGIVSKGYYLKNKHNLSYTRFTSSTFASFFCFLAVNGFTGLLVMLYAKLFTNNPTPAVLVIAFAAMTAVILVFWLPVDRFKMPARVQNLTHQAVEGWVVIGKSPLLLVRLVVIQMLLVLLLSLRYYIAFHMLSQSVGLYQTLLFASASILTQLVSIAPGGLGVREAIVAAAASALGFDPAISVVAIGLDRLVMTVMIVLTGWISTVILGRDIADVPEAS
jgi:uncharacterized membrane protein YbhN (UPF0104 family)